MDFKKLLAVCLAIYIVGLHPLSAAAQAATSSLKPNWEQRVNTGDIVISERAKHGAQCELLENPAEYDAGVFVVGGMMVAGVALAFISAYNAHAQYRRGGVGFVEGGVALGVELLVVKGVGAIKGVSFVTAPASVVVGSLNVLWDMGLIDDQTVDKFTGNVEWANPYKAGAKVMEKYGPKLLAELLYGQPASPFDFHTSPSQLASPNSQIGSIYNPVDNTPRPVSFTETFSGFNSATPDFPGSQESTLTYSGLTGERTGVLPGGLRQSMNGRFKSYEGQANTFVDAPINGRVTGDSIFIHGRPIQSQATLSMVGIGDFRTALGPFTINPNGTAAGTFYGNTFAPGGDPTGDVVLNYSANTR